MNRSELKDGDILFHEADGLLGRLIVNATGGRWSHVGQWLDGKVSEMTFPKCRSVSLETWREDNGPLYVGRLIDPLDGLAVDELRKWWDEHFGEWYNVVLLFREAPVAYWQRMCLKIAMGCKTKKWREWWIARARIQPLTIGHVCSTAIAEACKAAGLPVTETSGMTPEDLATQSFLCPIERVEY